MIYGDFKIKLKVDRIQSNAGEAINGTIKITGNGNLEDLEDFKLKIKNVTIYNDAANIENGDFIQKFAIIGQRDFTIPSFKLDFLDKNTQAPKTITTSPIKIKIKGTIAPKKLNNTTPVAPIKHKKNNLLAEYYLLLGMAIGLFVCWLFGWLKRPKNKKDKNLIKLIKLARNDKSLFDILMPLHLKSLSNIVIQLEENIYKNAKHKINKKAIIRLL
jgi:hypothetical protein